MVLAKYGENTELDEDASGNTVIRNTATGTEVLLADFVDIVGSFGSAANRIDGESFFDQLNANSVETSTVIDSDDATSYDVGDDLASGAFSDGDNDGTYTLPNPDDGIEVGSVNTEEVDTGTTFISDQETPSVDDTSTVIFDEFPYQIARFTVYGFTSDGFDGFVDKVIAFSGSTSSISQEELAIRNNPDGRTYSNEGGALSLAMDSGDYAVTATAISLKRSGL